MKILGIDLGTTNTYIFGVEDFCNSPSFQREPAPLIIPPVTDDQGSCATAVLYENDKPVAIGNIAESEFYSCLAKQKFRTLAAQFKPEIGRGDAAVLRFMTDFLFLLRNALPKGVLENDTKIYAGIPALAREDFSLNLGKCFKDAKWPMPVFVNESDAALVSCLQSGALDIDDMEQKCLIIDFGGGTFDYTAVEGLETLQNGGDILYGGRLFDDLFFQLFCRTDPAFAMYAPFSPAAWHLHWVECREQKELFSDFLERLPDKKEGEDSGITLHASWIDSKGQRQDSYVCDYKKDSFVIDAENYIATDSMLEVIKQYCGRGGLSRTARELLEGRQIGLIFWLRSILLEVNRRNEVYKIVLTGGSSRWEFVAAICKSVFVNASIIKSRRSYEDIGFGLALFPVLQSSHDTALNLLNQKLFEFGKKAAAIVEKLVDSETANIISMCTDRMIMHDVMPVFEAAQKKSMTIGEIEKKIALNISQDDSLKQIIRAKGINLGQQIQRELQGQFRNWLRLNGVLLVPHFEFPENAIGEEFFDRMNLKLSDMDLIKLIRMTIVALIPVISGAGAAHFLAPFGEPVSIAAGIGLAGGLAWVTARAAPSFLEKRKLPSFLLTEKLSKKIVEKNRKAIGKALTNEFGEVKQKIIKDAEQRLEKTLKSMLGKLSILNQIQTR